MGNGQKGVWGTAAFGVHVMEVISAADDRWIIENQVEPGEEGEEKALCEVCSAPVRYCVCSTDRAPAEVAPPPEDESADRPAVARADLWGPVVIEEGSRWGLKCLKGTNNTRELCSVMQALLWMLYVAPADGRAVVVLCDSHYAMGVAKGLIDAKSNLEAAVLVQELLQWVQRQRCLTFCHVKGHSKDGGNDRADELVWWGKEAGGSFCRIALDGQGEGEGRYRPEPGYDNRRNARLAARAAQGDVSRRSSVGGDGDGDTTSAGGSRAHHGGGGHDGDGGSRRPVRGGDAARGLRGGTRGGCEAARSSPDGRTK